MKNLCPLLFALTFHSFHPVFAQPGVADPTFGIQGASIVHISEQLDYATSAVSLPDGSILVGGNAAPSVLSINNSFTFIYKLLNNGVLDTSFHIHTHDLAPGKEFLIKAILAPDGGLIALSQLSDPVFSQFVMISRFLPDGELDMSFGQQGNVITNLGYSDAIGGDFALTPEGEILVCGWGDFGAPGAAAWLLRLAADGAPDTTFGANGLAVIDFPSNEYFYKMALLPDGKILCSGKIVEAQDNNVLLARFTPEGMRDNTFGENGLKISPPLGNIVDVNGILTGTDGRFYVQEYNRVGRYESDGSLDVSFGQGGFAGILASEMVLLPNGKLLGFGNRVTQFTFDTLIWLDQLLPDGQVDVSFGINGRITTDLAGDVFHGSMDQNGHLLIAGMHGLRIDQDSAVAQAVVFRLLTELSTGVFDTPDAENAVLVYPNPVGEQAHFSFELKKPSRLSLRLLDMNGRVVQDFFTNRLFDAGKQTETLQFSSALSRSPYVLVLEGEGKRVSTRIVLH